MYCFLCCSYYHGAIVCLDCMAPYCSFDCLHKDTMHGRQCKLKQAPVACVFCLDPVKCKEGFTNPCGHGIHGTCAMVCEHYGLQGCPGCPSSNALEQMGRLMVKEYARFCFTALRANLPVPELPSTLMRFLEAETRGGADARELMYMYGTIFANGLGVTADETKAHYWLSRAAAFGHGHAMYAVSGSSEERLRVAAKRGSPHACFELATITETMDESWLLKSLELAPFDVQVRLFLATHYEKTGRVLEALPHHFMLARQGHSGSLERLARLYFDMAVDNQLFLIQSAYWASRAVPSPAVFKTRALIALRLSYDEAAFHLMEKAAVGSCPVSTDALYELARFHVLGVGTPVDHVQAERLLEVAAAAGQPSAQFDLAMKRWETDNGEAMKLVRAASKTHAVAMHFLSRYDVRRELLERAGEFIPAALYDLAVRHARAADIQDAEMNYGAAAELLERALNMPTPTFECAPLDVERTKSFLTHLRKRLRICGSLQVASMDTILRLAQFTGTAVLVDITERKLCKF